MNGQTMFDSKAKDTALQLLPSVSLKPSEFTQKPPSKSGENINVNEQDLSLITKQTWEAIKKQNNPPAYFRHGDSLCRLEKDNDNQLEIRTLTEPRLRYELAELITWFKLDRHLNECSAKPPKDLVTNLLATPNPPLPVLDRITEVPVFCSDGTLITDAGYHETARLYYSPATGLEVGAIPDNPTPEQIQNARSLILDDLLCDFPFVDESDKSHAVALFLLPCCRDLIDGPTPNHLVESPTPGTGKDLLIEVCLRSALGPSALGTLSQATNEEEWRRRLTACFRQPSGSIHIGNITKPLNSGALAAALTAKRWDDRVLRTNDLISLPVRHVWTTTGNNPILSSEIARRSIRIRIDAQLERPWERSNFKHSNLSKWTEKNRANLLRGGLILIQAWIAADKPSFTEKSLGSFESWSNVMGGILEVAGIQGFLRNLHEFYEVSDPESKSWKQFVASWWDNFSYRPVRTKTLLQLAEEANLEISGFTDHANNVSLGKKLIGQRDRVIGGYKIVQTQTKKQRASLWELSSVSSESR